MAKIDIEKLQEMIDQGKSQREIADFFSCSSAAVCKQLKKLNIAVIRHSIVEHAPKIAEKKFDAMEQLRLINDHALWLLDHLMSWIKGDPSAIQVLEGSVRKVNIGSREEPNYVEGYKFKNPHEIALKAMNEIRGQFALQLDIAKTLYNADVIQEFMAEVKELMEEVDPELRKRFVDKIRRRAGISLNLAVSTL